MFSLRVYFNPRCAIPFAQPDALAPGSWLQTAHYNQQIRLEFRHHRLQNAQRGPTLEDVDQSGK